MRTIYRITGFGDTAYYTTLPAAQREIRTCGGNHARTRLTVQGDRILDESGATVGDVISDADVPTSAQWQLK